LAGGIGEAMAKIKETIHRHMIEEKPRILFLHYWGKGKAIDLANGIKSALATQAKD
jgi:hypothetical protein